jgi:N-formylglutamate amidohydrolase
MEAEGLEAVPSPSDPGPGSGSYFSGGYITKQFGSQLDKISSMTDAIQIECSREQRGSDNRAAFAAALARAIKNFVEEHY